MTQFLKDVFHLLTFTNPPPVPSLPRYIVLDNGLRALLISDYSGLAASEDEDEDEDEDGEEEEEEGEEEEDDESGDESDDEEDDDEQGSDGDYEDDDDEGTKKKRNAEKQVPQRRFLTFIFRRLNCVNVTSFNV